MCIPKGLNVEYEESLRITIPAELEKPLKGRARQIERVLDVQRQKYLIANFQIIQGHGIPVNGEELQTGLPCKTAVCALQKDASWELVISNLYSIHHAVYSKRCVHPKDTPFPICLPMKSAFF